MGTSVSQREALTWLARVLCVVGSISLVLSSVLDQRGLLAAAGLLCLLLLISVLSLSRRDGEALLTAMVACVLLIPENLVLVGPLRSVGNPAELVGLVCLALWAAGRMLGLLGFQQGHPGRWALLVFCLAGAASFVAAQLRHLSFAETAATNRIGFLLVAAVGIAIMATDGLEDRRRFDSLILRVVLISGVAAAIGIVEFLQESFHYADLKLPGLTSYSEVASETRGAFERISGAAAHPIEYAVVLAALAPLALHLAIAATGRGERTRSAFAFLAIVAVVPMSVSRGGLLALAVGLAFYVCHLSARARVNFAILGLIGLGMFRAAVPGLLGTLQYLITIGSADSSIEARTQDYALIPGLMDGHWWFGRGLGTFVPTQYFYLDNQYLGSLLEGGFVGMAAFAGLIVTGVCLARGARHRSADAYDRGLGQALAGSIAALGVAAVTFDELNFRQTGFMLFLLIGCAGALWTHQRAQPKRFRNGSLRPEQTSTDPSPIPAPSVPVGGRW